ncbi:MAG: hypothetical protein ACRDQ4_07915 [Pseudonocardiaceae bacterium]
MTAPAGWPPEPGRCGGSPWPQTEQAVTTWFDRAIKEFNNAVAEFEDLAENIARGAVRWVTGGQPEPPKEPWRGWPHQPDNLPPSGDKQWLQVGEFMRELGVI